MRSQIDQVEIVVSRPGPDPLTSVVERLRRVELHRPGQRRHAKRREALCESCVPRSTSLTSVPHTDILSLNAFYATAWKTGKYPAISSDRVWIMARPHPAWAGAWGDSQGPPENRGYVGPHRHSS